MDSETWHRTPGASATKADTSVSKIGHSGRRTAVIDEGHHGADRSKWSRRWQHPLVKSIHDRRGKARRP